MLYKTTIHVPTNQFEFIEVEAECTLEEAQSIKDQINSFNEYGDGLNAKEWSRVRNEYVTNGKISIEDWQKCNKLQKHVINEVKLVYKSLNNK